MIITKVFPFDKFDGLFDHKLLCSKSLVVMTSDDVFVCPHSRNNAKHLKYLQKDFLPGRVLKIDEIRLYEFIIISILLNNRN